MELSREVRHLRLRELRRQRRLQLPERRRGSLPQPLPRGPDLGSRPLSHRSARSPVPSCNQLWARCPTAPARGSDGGGPTSSSAWPSPPRRSSTRGLPADHPDAAGPLDQLPFFLNVAVDPYMALLADLVPSTSAGAVGALLAIFNMLGQIACDGGRAPPLGPARRRSCSSSWRRALVVSFGITTIFIQEPRRRRPGRASRSGSTSAAISAISPDGQAISCSTSVPLRSSGLARAACSPTSRASVCRSSA